MPGYLSAYRRRQDNRLREQNQRQSSTQSIERAKAIHETVLSEEHRLNELTRGRQHSRINHCRGTTRYAGGCRRKIHRQQRMIKRRPEEAGPLISALMAVLSVVQSGNSWIEAAVAIGALCMCAIALSATTMVMCTVGALFTGRCSVTHATLARLKKDSEYRIKKSNNTLTHVQIVKPTLILHCAQREGGGTSAAQPLWFLYVEGCRSSCL